MSKEPRLKIAIIGGGPGGLGAAIEFAKLPFVDWDLYEKSSLVSEIGGGFTIQPQTWRLLEHNGAADNIRSEDYFRPEQGQIEQRRNGRTGELLIEKCHEHDVPLKRRSCRLARTKLQNGTEDQVDLLVAADDIRSSIRQFCFPNHILRYNGQSVYRTIVSKNEVAKIEGIPWAPVFWKHVSGLYVFTCPLGGDDFEVTARIRETERRLRTEYHDFCRPVRQILGLAAGGDTQEFALFSGNHLSHVISGNNIAMIGDASQALLGNFGSGAAFALEDAYTLARAIKWAWLGGKTLKAGLELFDYVRSPHYRRLHNLVSRFAEIKAELRAKSLTLDDEIAERVKRISKASESWMYDYEIDKVVDKALEAADMGMGQ
ncbi:hypothetical protein NXS19_008042 [Fusarium pseudograminearum]|nr:hypothetical protein NXS19_008042 [Fusarium pseudograminearum]